MYIAVFCEEGPCIFKIKVDMEGRTDETPKYLVNQ